MTTPTPSRLRLEVLASLFAALVAAGLSSSDARAQGTPDSLTFQGLLTGPGGVPLDTTVEMSFKLYKDNISVWTETHVAVIVTNGIFNVLLGSLTPLDTLDFDQPMELGITVGLDSETAPRTPLGAAAFALALRGIHAVWADDGVNKSYNVIGGAPNNTVTAGAVGATIGGGGGTAPGGPGPNSVTNDFGTVSGGRNNLANSAATVGGGSNNSASNVSATVGGGAGNSAAGLNATVAGGSGNSANNTAAVVGGGDSNTASALGATVSGGAVNTASGQYATVPGGTLNTALGTYSFAAGRRAKANHSGSFVWADATPNSDFVSTATDQFLVRASNGVGIGINNPTHPLEMASGAHVTVGGVWTDASSRTLKQDFQAVEVGAILEEVVNLPVTRWRYKNEPDAVHMGPVAEDFHELFGLGPDGGHIAALDGNGVALAAIQGLYDLLRAQQADMAEQKAEIEALRKDLRRKQRAW